MTISGVSSNTIVSQNGALSQLQQMGKDFADLGQCLNSGDLEGARKAFATLKQDLQNVGQSQNVQQTGGSSQLSNDLAALGNVLQSGDLAGARKAFATLAQNIQSFSQSQSVRTHGNPRNHHHADMSNNTTATLQNDLAALGNVLQAGSLAGAKKAFAAMAQGTAQKTTAAFGIGTNLQFATSNINITV
jgi:hypothetical protein